MTRVTTLLTRLYYALNPGYWRRRCRLLVDANQAQFDALQGRISLYLNEIDRLKQERDDADCRADNAIMECIRLEARLHDAEEKIP